jgi:uncharacterized protein
MFRLLLLILWLPAAALAQTYPEPLSDTVSDYADLLPPEEEARVAAALQAARDETGVHVVLVTIERQAYFGGTGRFADFATGWFNAWGIGDKTRNDGVLILVGHEDREMRIALGEGYDVIWDGRAQRVIDTAMLPAFRKDDYAKGLEDGAMMAIDLIARPFAANEPIEDESGWSIGDILERIFKIAVLIGFVAIMLGVMFKDWLRDFLLRFRACPNCGARRMQARREVLVEAGQTTDGQAVRHETCGQCGNDRTETFSLPSKEKQRRAKSRSSSGFGGGRSGGGGASGKW